MTKRSYMVELTLRVTELNGPPGHDVLVAVHVNAENELTAIRTVEDRLQRLIGDTERGR